MPPKRKRSKPLGGKVNAERSGLPAETKKTAPETPKVDPDKDRRARLMQKKDRHAKKEIETKIPQIDPQHQKLFEAPDGGIVVGDIRADRIFYRPLGIWINPMRIHLTPDQRAKKQAGKA